MFWEGSLMGQYGVSVPKGESRLDQRVKQKRARFLQGRAFRKAVWDRDQGICQHCGQRVKRTLELDPLRGEVHHLRPRSVAPEAKYDPENGILLCLEDHLKAQKHEIEVRRP